VKRKSKLLIGGVVLLGVVAVAAKGFSSDDTLQVRVEAIEKRDVVSTITAIGQLRARQQVNISSDVVGRVVQVFVREGDQVEQGQVLLTIDPKQVEAAVARAQASLSQSEAQVVQQQANLQQSERELSRLLELRTSGIAPLQELEAAQTRVAVQRSNLAVSEHGVEQARAALGEAEDQLSKTTVRAPIAGKVVRMNIKAGETAIMGTMNNAGSLLLAIADLGGIDVFTTLDETEIPKVSIGDSAVVGIDAFPDRTFAARVSSISTAANTTSGQAAALGGSVSFQVWLNLLDPTPELRPDLSATVDLIVEHRADAVAVPIISVTTKGNGTQAAASSDEAPPQQNASTASGPMAQSEKERAETGVFKVRNGKAVWTPVTYGITGQGHFEVLTGLQVGDTVVSGPYSTIRTLTDGAAVRVTSGSTPTPTPKP
jgi:HlyD family secretion protein